MLYWIETMLYCVNQGKCSTVEVSTYEKVSNEEQL